MYFFSVCTALCRSPSLAKFDKYWKKKKMFLRNTSATRGNKYTLRGRSRRGQRRDPQYGAPNFRQCIVHFAHGRWNDTDCA